MACGERRPRGKRLQGPVGVAHRRRSRSEIDSLDSRAMPVAPEEIAQLRGGQIARPETSRSSSPSSLTVAGRKRRKAVKRISTTIATTMMIATTIRVILTQSGIESPFDWIISRNPPSVISCGGFF